MRFQKKLCVIAVASLFPVASALAQTSADTRKEIDALKAQLQLLQEKLEALSAATGEGSPLSQQVNRLEQKIDLSQTTSEASGFSGMKINGVTEAAYKYNDFDKKHDFSAGSGYNVGEFGMVQITKESQDGEVIDWTLRLLPGGAPLVHEASLSIPLNKENRIIAGLIPDFQGYEFAFANANSTLGNQFITHNALYDLAGATVYTGLGMSHTFQAGKYAFKWLVGNVDKGGDDSSISYGTDPATGLPLAAAPTNASTVALAYRLDYYPDDATYIGLSGLHGSSNRSFNIMAVDAGYTRGDWQYNGQVTVGEMLRAAANGGKARWAGVSGFVGYKIVPRLQLLARADYIQNRANGGGTYYDNGGTFGNGLGPELNTAGEFALDDLGYATTGANLTRLTFGTNYQINANTQWKTEYRLDQSSGYNFVTTDADTTTYSKTKTSWGTSLVLSF
jgi:hypothetical protein